MSGTHEDFPHPALRPLFLPPGEALAHPHDSLALSEHIDPAHIQPVIDGLSKAERSNFTLLQRADQHYELALSTPTTDNDMSYFEAARNDINTILASDLPMRHRIRFNATLLGIYEKPFMARAYDKPITAEIQAETRSEVCEYTSRFTEDDDLTEIEQGQLAELVALGYLLNSDHFPFIGLNREEANMITQDNHDLYTLHTLEDGRILKAPSSIKFRERPSLRRREVSSIITYYVGNMAMDAASGIAPYNQMLTDRGYADAVKALRLAADVMVCDALGEKLGAEDKALLWTLTSNFQARINDYITRFTPPDYARNARAINQVLSGK